jgi:hypothetical protein
MYVLFQIRVPTGGSATSIALESGSVVVELRQIPNQPIIFAVSSHLILFNIYIRCEC